MAKLASRNIEKSVAAIKGGAYGVFFANSNERAYKGTGISKSDAERLSNGLLAATEVRSLDA